MGIFTDAINSLKDSLSRCVGLQKWLGVDQEADPVTAAAAKIYIDGYPLPPDDQDELTVEQMNEMRPLCLLYPSDASAFDYERVGEPECFALGGELIIVLEKQYVAKDPQELWLESMAQLEKIADNDDPAEPGLKQLNANQGLRIQSIRADIFGRTPLTDRNKLGDAYIVLLVIKWG